MSLLNLIRTNKDARKIFGKRELKIIEKQLLGVFLTQSEKNRLSRDIRKKLEFVKELSRFSGEFELKKGSEIKRMVDDAKDSIINHEFFSRIKKIILYGSASENDLTLSSDIDIAVEFSEITLKDATLFRKSILGIVNQRVDVQVYNLLPDKIKKEILLKGRILYEK